MLSATPFLFPDGRDGWHIGFQCSKPGSNTLKKVSASMMYYLPFLFKHKDYGHQWLRRVPTERS